MLESRWAKIDILLNYFNINNIEIKKTCVNLPFQQYGHENAHANFPFHINVI